MSEVDLSRRNFIKAALAVPVGIAVGAALYPAAVEVNDETTKLTEHPAGNAGAAQEVENACSKTADQNQCYENYQPPLSEKIYAVVVAPVIEESIFRAVPSFITDVSSSGDEDEAIGNITHGTERLGITRSELIGGAVSSLIFGAAHNFTNSGFDTKTIPASQTASGFVFWCLQRRFGILSNMAAHSTLNFIAMNS